MGEDKVAKFEEVLGWVNGWVEGTVFADGTGTSIARLTLLCILLATLAFLDTYSKKLKANPPSKLKS